MAFSFLSDEHVKRIYLTELRSNGYDVASVGSEYDEGVPDTEHLATSRRTGRIVLSNDSDFADLHTEYDHAGIVLYNDQDMPVRDFIRGIKTIERYVPEAELQGELVWLDEWI